MATTPEDFDAVFRRGYPSLVRTLTTMCGDREVAADCVQDAFAKAFARWRKVARYDQPLAWVRHVAVNNLRDHLRRGERDRRYAPRIAAPDQVSDAEPAGYDLRTALDSLPTQQRIAAALFYVDQLSVQEVADTMGVSTGAVKFHLHSARERLRALLAHHDPAVDAS